MRKLMSLALFVALACAAVPSLAHGQPPPMDRREAHGEAWWERYQDSRRGPEQTERFSRSIKAGRGTALDLSNISGDIVVTAGGGSDIVIEAVKRARGRDGSAQDLLAGERLFARAGGWLVVLSRWLPVFPEVIACMAGLSRMPALPFFTALACGSAPLGFAFAAIGHAGVDHPVLAIALSGGLPPLLWLLVQHHVRARQAAHVEESRCKDRGSHP